MKRDKKRFPLLLTCLALVLTVLPTTAKADFGDKPSIHIIFKDLSGGLCYGTLLSEKRSTGPHTAWDGTDEGRYRGGRYEDAERAVWDAFQSYEDPDGFYFLQDWWDCSETGKLDWTYYPPQTFKILLYFPETGRFAVSDILEKYAFDSFYTVDASAAASGQHLTVSESYDYAASLFSLACRAVLTILVELAIALLFGFWQKKRLLWIARVNIITQLLLSLALNLIIYRWGGSIYIFSYLLLEIGVFLIEAVLYAARLDRIDGDLRQPGKRQVSLFRSTAYALCANAVSFLTGLYLSYLIPGIFY